MQQREKILAIGFVIAIVLWQGWPLIQRTFFQPLDNLRAELKSLDTTIETKENQQLQMIQAAARLGDWRTQSLPENDLDAQRLYQQWLTDLTQVSNWKNVRVTPGRRIDRGEGYAALQVTVEGTATMEQFAQFLYHFDRIHLLHRIERLGIERTGEAADAPLKISLVAEGVSLDSAADFDLLFPQTILASDLSRADDKVTLKAASAGWEPGMRIRIGDEYVRVISGDGEIWTVRRGVDGTSAQSHPSGALVELAPVAPDEESQEWSDYSQFVANSPFRRPAPPAEKPAPRPEPETDEARDFRLVGALVQRGQPEAWLHNANKNVRLVLTENNSFSVGDFDAEVIEIGRTHVLLRADNSTWKLELGDSLRAMSRVSEPAQITSPPSAPGSSGEGETIAVPATESLN